MSYQFPHDTPAGIVGAAAQVASAGFAMGTLIVACQALRAQPGMNRRDASDMGRVMTSAKYQQDDPFGMPDPESRSYIGGLFDKLLKYYETYGHLLDTSPKYEDRQWGPKAIAKARAEQQKAKENQNQKSRDDPYSQLEREYMEMTRFNDSTQRDHNLDQVADQRPQRSSEQSYYENYNPSKWLSYGRS